MVTIPAYTPPLDEVTTALLTLFRQSGRTIYDGAYDGDPVKPTYPYGILFSLPGGSADPMPDMDLDRRTVTATWQVSGVSKLRNQAENTGRVFRDLLTARTGSDWTYPLVVPDGWVCAQRTPDAVLAGVIRAGDPPNAIFSAPVRFTLTLVPA